MKFSFKRFSESYIDTLAKLYRYSTTNYSKKRQSSVIGTDGGYTFAEFKKTCDDEDPPFPLQGRQIKIVKETTVRSAARSAGSGENVTIE